MKRCFLSALSLLLALCLASPALAGVVPGSNFARLLIEEDQVEIYLKNWEEFTIVTPENLEDHMDLATLRGETPEDARFRFQHGNIVLEAYNPKLFPYGVMRVQRFEDELSRNYWNSNDLPYNQMSSLIQDLSGSLYHGYLNLFQVRQKEWFNGLYGSVIWYPPFEYESGLFCLYILNGVTYLVSYMQRTFASAERYFYNAGYHTNADGFEIVEMVYSHVRNHLPVINQNDGVQLVGPKQTPVADLSTDDSRLILNAHSGPFTMTGGTEAGAEVSVRVGDSAWQATVNADKTYACEIDLAPGENDVISVANKAGLGENTLHRTVSADDTMAALELTQFPYGPEIRDQLRVKGKASPGAQVLVQLDDGEEVPVPVSENGAFDYPFTVDKDWVDYDITIIAREEGLADCSARFTFYATYEEAQRGNYYYRQTLTPGLSVQDILSDPAAHVGDRVSLDVQMMTVRQRDGLVTCEGRINQDPKKNILVIFPDYMEDQVYPGILLTVCGELDEPTLTDPPVPRLNVQYATNLIVEYVYR